MARFSGNLAILLANPDAVQIADYQMEPDGIPPCFCTDGGYCRGDCPYCRVGGFVLHEPGEDW